MFKRGEEGTLLPIIVAPVWRGIERAGEMCACPVRGEQREAGANGGGTVGDLMAEAQRQQGRVAQVQFGDAI